MSVCNSDLNENFNTSLGAYTDNAHVTLDNGRARIDHPSYDAPANDFGQLGYAGAGFTPLPANAKIKLTRQIIDADTYNDGNLLSRIIINISGVQHEYHQLLWEDVTSADNGVENLEIDLASFQNEELRWIRVIGGGYDTGGPGSIVAQTFIGEIVVCDVFGSPLVLVPSAGGIPRSIMLGG